MMFKLRNKTAKTKVYYTIERADNTGRIDSIFQTYKEAFDYMCKTYVREINEDYKPCLYKILQHTVIIRDDIVNEVVKFVLE